MTRKPRIFAALLVAAFLAACSGATHGVLPGASPAAAKSPGIHPFYNAGQYEGETESCQTNGGTWDNSTMTCIMATPPPYDFGCDMVCQAWNSEPIPTDLLAYEWTNNGAGGGGASYDVAIHPGPPRDAVGCNGSLNVGDNLGLRNGNTQTVKDLNVVVVPMNMASGSSNNTMTISVGVVGYIYQDTNNNYWYQSALGSSWNATLNAGPISVGIGGGNATTISYLGSSAPTVSGGNFYGSATAQPCFTEGMHV